MSTTPTQSIAVPEPGLTQEEMVQRARDMIPTLRERAREQSSQQEQSGNSSH